jgi:hypothetical protein
MQHGLNIIVDVKSEIYPFIKHLCDFEFEEFSKQESIPNSVYVLGHTQAYDNIERVQQMAVDPRFVMVYCNSNEGSQIFINRLEMLGLKELALSGKVLTICTGDLGPDYHHLPQEYWLNRTYSDPRNQPAIKNTDVFSKVNKPYTFLFLNGSARPHRKFLVERLRESGQLDNALWTWLDNRNSLSRDFSLPRGHNKGVTVPDGPIQLMLTPNVVRWLPPKYEVNEVLTQEEFMYRYQQRIPKEEQWKNSQFDRPGQVKSPRVEIYLKPEPYEDTYFSLVTESEYQYPYSLRSEKIAKPLALGHPWIVASNKGFYREMHNLGFRTFDGIIDESFDQIDNHQDRMERIVQTVCDLCSQDLPSFLAACKDICKYNQQHLAAISAEENSNLARKFSNFINPNDRQS